MYNSFIINMVSYNTTSKIKCKMYIHTFTIQMDCCSFFIEFTSEIHYKSMF